MASIEKSSARERGASSATHAQLMANEERKGCPQRRLAYAQRRLTKLRESLPDLPGNVLDTVSLRHLSAVVRRCSGDTGSQQTVLQAQADRPHPPCASAQ